MKTVRNAIVLSSGGLDSTTVKAIAGQQGFGLYSLSFDYGQRHSVELEAAGKVADRFKVKQHLVNRAYGQWAGRLDAKRWSIDISY